MRCGGYTGQLNSPNSALLALPCVTVGKVVNLCALFHHLVSGDSAFRLCQALWRALDVEGIVCWTANFSSWQDSVSLGASVYLKRYFLYFGEWTVMLLLIYVKAGNCFSWGLKSLQSIMSYINGAYWVKVVQLFSLTKLDAYKLFSLTDWLLTKKIWHLYKIPCQGICFAFSNLATGHVSHSVLVC